MNYPAEMRRRRTYGRVTTDVVAAVGVEVAQGRRHHRLTIADLAERAGTSPSTVQRVERGDPTVALGTVVEIGRLVGLRFFGGSADEVGQHLERGRDRLVLMPQRVRMRDEELDDDF